MGAALRKYLTIAIAGAGLIAVPPTQAVAAHAEAHSVLLTSVDSPFGSGTALIPGASLFATPSQGWLDAFAELYLTPHGFTGTTQAVTTPESLYPFTGPFSMTLDKSVAQGVQILEEAIKQQIAAGGVSADNPVIVSGYSQSSTVDSLLMTKLAADGIDSQLVRFVLLGDPSNPNGGLLERFALPEGSTPEAPSLGLTFSGATPSDLYRTDIYTYEYDGFAHFPKYPINVLADINAYLGILFNHGAYLGVTPERLMPVADGGSLVQLPTLADDGLTNYYMILSDSLPLLAPLRLLPILGNPLADLLQPALSVLINLGYGSVTDSWSGYADVPTTMGFLPDQSVLDQVPAALLAGLQQGVQDAITTLSDPDNYQLISPQTMDYVLDPLLRSATMAFNLDGSQEDISNYLSTFLSGALNWFTEGVGELSLTHTGLPPLDMASALFFTLPQIAVEMFNIEMAAGNPIDAIGEPLAALVGLAPLMLAGAIF